VLWDDFIPERVLMHGNLKQSNRTVYMEAAIIMGIFIVLYNVHGFQSNLQNNKIKQELRFQLNVHNI